MKTNRPIRTISSGNGYSESSGIAPNSAAWLKVSFTWKDDNDNVDDGGGDDDNDNVDDGGDDDDDLMLRLGNGGSYVTMRKA